MTNDTLEDMLSTKENIYPDYSVVNFETNYEEKQRS